MTPARFDQLAWALLAFVLDSALRAVVVAGLMGAALMLLARTRAALRLKAWTVVLYGLLALPVLGFVTPTWSWPVPSPGVFEVWAPAPAPAASTGSLAVVTAVTSAVPDVRSGARVSVLVVVAALYVSGVVWFAWQIGLGWFAARRLRRSSRLVSDPAARQRLARHSAAAGLAVPPRLLESPRLSVPVMMSVRRPVVVLPDDWRAWPADHLDAVLAHEICHVARRDALTQRLALLYRTVFWFSPLSWWLASHLARLAEHASDEAALGAGIAPVTYADALLGFFVRAHERRHRATWHVAMARRADADAARRIDRILSWKGGPSMTRTRLVLAGVGVLIAPLAVIAASVRFTPEIPPSMTVPATLVSDAAPLPQPVPPPHLASNVKSQSSRPVPKAAPVQPPAVQTPASQTPAEPQAPEDDFLKGSYEDNTAGLIKPKMVTWSAPKYTPDGMRQKLQGTVVVDAIVATDGTVSKARIKVSLDKIYGLDEAALDAARKWTFTPGTLKDEPVPVHVVFQLEFRLH